MAEVREIRRRAVREAIDKARLQEASAGSEAGTPTEEPIPESEPEPPNKFCSGLFLEIEALRDEAEDEMQGVERLQEECRQAREQDQGPKE